VKIAVHSGESSTLRIRLGTLGNAERVGAIDVATWAPDNSPDPAPIGDPAQYAERLVNGGVLVADCDGHVAGYLGMGQPSRVASNRHVDIIDVWVHPDFQRPGSPPPSCRRRSAWRTSAR